MELIYLVYLVITWQDTQDPLTDSICCLGMSPDHLWVRWHTGKHRVGGPLQRSVRDPRLVCYLRKFKKEEEALNTYRLFWCVILKFLFWSRLCNWIHTSKFEKFVLLFAMRADLLSQRQSKNGWCHFYFHPFFAKEIDLKSRNVMTVKFEGSATSFHEDKAMNFSQFQHPTVHFNW